MFEIGDKVKCVDDSIKPELIISVMRDFQYWPIKDSEYYIRDIFYNDDIVAGIVLQGIYNKPINIPLLKRTQEPAYATWRFSKQQEAEMSKKSDELSREEIYKRILNR